MGFLWNFSGNSGSNIWLSMGKCSAFYLLSIAWFSFFFGFQYIKLNISGLDENMASHLSILLAVFVYSNRKALKTLKLLLTDFMLNRAKLYPKTFEKLQTSDSDIFKIKPNWIFISVHFRLRFCDFLIIVGV